MKIVCNYTKLKTWGLFLLALCFPLESWAAFSIGDAAQNLMVPTEILTKLLLISCYIIGIALILGAIVQYKIHRQSPKLVPLTTPITLLILGLVSVFIPYGTKMFGPTFSAEGQSRLSEPKPNLLPLPDTTKGPTLLPLPPIQRSAPQPPPPAPPPQQQEYIAPSVQQVPPSNPRPQYRHRDRKSHTPSGGGGGDGHWTSDPRYN